MPVRYQCRLILGGRRVASILLQGVPPTPAPTRAKAGGANEWRSRSACTMKRGSNIRLYNHDGPRQGSAVCRSKLRFQEQPGSCRTRHDGDYLKCEFIY